MIILHRNGSLQHRKNVYLPSGKMSLKKMTQWHLNDFLINAVPVWLLFEQGIAQWSDMLMPPTDTIGHGHSLPWRHLLNAFEAVMHTGCHLANRTESENWTDRRITVLLYAPSVWRGRGEIITAMQNVLCAHLLHYFASFILPSRVSFQHSLITTAYIYSVNWQSKCYCNL